MFIIRQLSSFCWSQWMVCVSYLFVCCFLICSQKKRAFTIKHGPKTTCFPARFTSWHLWYSLVCKDCLQTCRTLFNCFESVSVIIKFKQNFFFFSYYFFSLIVLRRETQKHIFLWGFLLQYCYSNSTLGWIGLILLQWAARRPIKCK